MAEIGLDLLPKQIKDERKISKLFHRASIISIAVFLILLIISFSIYFYASQLSKASDNLDKEINKELTKMNSFDFIEKISQDIFIRYSKAQELLEERPSYSKLLESITHITPPQVRIDTLTSDSETKITVTGEASGYIDLAKFLEAVADQKADIEGIFTSVILNSVSLDKQTGVAKFSLSLILKESALVERTLD